MSRHSPWPEQLAGQMCTATSHCPLFMQSLTHDVCQPVAVWQLVPSKPTSHLQAPEARQTPCPLQPLQLAVCGDTADADEASRSASGALVGIKRALGFRRHQRKSRT